MTDLLNMTTPTPAPDIGGYFVEEHEPAPTRSLLWLPYVLLAIILLAMTFASFLHYHIQNKAKYFAAASKKHMTAASASKAVVFAPPMFMREKHRVTMSRTGRVSQMNMDSYSFGPSDGSGSGAVSGDCYEYGTTSDELEMARGYSGTRQGGGGTVSCHIHGQHNSRLAFQDDHPNETNLYKTSSKSRLIGNDNMRSKGDKRICNGGSSTNLRSHSNNHIVKIEHLDSPQKSGNSLPGQYDSPSFGYTNPAYDSKYDTDIECLQHTAGSSHRTKELKGNKRQQPRETPAMSRDHVQLNSPHGSNSPHSAFLNDDILSERRTNDAGNNSTYRPGHLDYNNKKHNSLVTRTGNELDKRLPLSARRLPAKPRSQSASFSYETQSPSTKPPSAASRGRRFKSSSSAEASLSQSMTDVKLASEQWINNMKEKTQRNSRSRSNSSSIGQQSKDNCVIPMTSITDNVF